MLHTDDEYKARLSAKELFALMVNVSVDYQLALPALSTFKTHMALPDLSAIITKNIHGIMWIDRYYLAIMPYDGEFRYIYIARRHILEEEESYEGMHMPNDIRVQFDTALKAEGVIWIDEEYRRKI